MKRVADKAVIEQLQRQIMALQTNHTPTEPLKTLDLGLMEEAFPEKVFPQGAMHEFISNSSEEAACTNGFMSMLLGKLMQQGSILWVSIKPRGGVYPPFLVPFGVAPERVLFVDTWKPKVALWVVEEALKCGALTAVVAEINELNFDDSRRLQLAVERSRVTGFIHRFNPKSKNPVACVSRWKISPLSSDVIKDKPGVGFPKWNVQLAKVKNGQPGEWQVKWSSEGLEYLKSAGAASHILERQTG